VKTNLYKTFRANGMERIMVKLVVSFFIAS